MSNLNNIELFAWIGEDEFGSGETGIKQARVPAGYIPIVAIERDKVDRDFIIRQMNNQAAVWGKKIRLCRFTFAEVLRETEAGKD